mmetsp:Transcript_2538/g.7752  ORF Transcript_2538/g.7752 Transcript_2538/m.7752 type:complete len:221 (+) Transcript_2538:425-1087(+)
MLLRSGPHLHRRGHLQVRDVLAPRPDVLPQVLLLPAAVALLRRGDAPRRQGEGGLLSDIRLLHGGPRPRRRNLRASTCFAGSSSARPRREPPRSAGASLDARSTGLCFQQPPVFQTIYLKTPTTCLSNDGICCCILHGDCAIPCDEGVPVACTLFYTGLLLYPKVACCTKAGDVFTVKEPLVGGPEIIHGAPRFSDLVEKHVFKKQPEPEESRGETADVA